MQKPDFMTNMHIGVIGSPSTTGALTIDILEKSAAEKLVGEMLIFEYEQDGLPHYALGQVTEVELRNQWLERTTMRSVARQKGYVYPISGTQDVHIAKMVVGAVFSYNGSGFEPSILGTVPPTGTPLIRVSDKILDDILSYRKDEIFYLGNIYGSDTKMPFWFKHFDTGREGAGEAYHIGIFGKTGSGKSVLAKMILTAYARHKNMGIIVIDPQGEFSADLRGDVTLGGFKLDLKRVLEESLRRKTNVLSIKNLVLDRWDLFSEILYESTFFEKLTIPTGDNRRLACETLVDKLKKAKVKLTDLHERSAFEKAWKILLDEDTQKIFYRSSDSRARFNSMIRSVDTDEFYEIWYSIANLFNPKRGNVVSIDNVLKNVFTEEEKSILVIDLSEESAGEIHWNESIQARFIKRILEGVRYEAEKAYKAGKSLNTLVLLDEAHRLAPREKPDNEQYQNIRSLLLDAVRTTRKYGLGWMFISQTLSSLHREIINQLRIMFFGFGLSMGVELQALKEIVGGNPEILGLYQSFKDPHSSFDIRNREYPFMTVGPVSPLSFSGTPLFFTAFNRPEEFLNANSLAFQTKLFQL
jgi:hypothetical protein